MSDWHFGGDYDMWLYPPVDWTSPDYDYELPEPIEAANIEGELLVNAKDAIEQVRRLQHENAKLRKLVGMIGNVCDGTSEVCKYCKNYSATNDECMMLKQMRELGVEVDG